MYPPNFKNCKNKTEFLYKIHSFTMNVRLKKIIRDPLHKQVEDSWIS
jgi:hypothetical protein